MNTLARSSSPPTTRRNVALTVALASLASCSGQDTSVLTRPPALEPTPADPGTDAPATSGSNELAPSGGTGSAEAAPLYVIANEVYTADDSTSYIHVLPSLDVRALDDAQALEYSGGRATIQTFGGALFVAGPESPVITRFSAAADGKLTETGAVGFNNYAFESVVIDDWSATFIDDGKAYLFNGVDGSTVIWNPTTLEILGEVDQSNFSLVRDAPLSLNYSQAAVVGNRLFRTVSWDDWDAGEFSLEQYLAIVDLTTDTLIELIPEDRCPSLGNRVSRDEEGNQYYSNWIWNVGQTLLGDGPKSCALRIDAGAERFREDWVLPYAEMTGGREAAMFRYLQNGKGLLSVFHDERATLDPELSPDELMSTNNWRVWSMDFEARTGAPLEGLDWMAGAASSFVVGGRTFIFVPADNWTVTHVYEIVGDSARPAFDIDGWSFQLARLR